MTTSNVLTYLKKKATSGVIRDEISHKSSYTTPEGSLDEKHGECVKAKKMFFYPKQYLFLDENFRQKGGGQLQLMDENGERP